MPSSPPEPPSPDSNTSLTGTTSTTMTWSPWATFSIVIGIIWMFVWNLGAAQLSYAKYGSVGWAILDFFFAAFYYPFYAFFLNTPTATMGGRRRAMKLW